MKAIQVRQFGAPDVLQVVDLPEPRPGPNEVVVLVRAIGVNPVDTYVRSGKYIHLPPLPYTPGTDCAGVVEGVGEGVRTCKPGDRVYTFGTITGAYAEKALCRAEQVHALADRASFAQGAGVGTPAGAAWRSLFVRARAQAAEIVLVHGGTGAVGTAAIQLARAAGMTVIATAGSEEGKRHASEQGAHFVTGHEEYGVIRSLTPDGRGVDVILEQVADKNLAADIGILAPCGRIVVIGAHGSASIEPRAIMDPERDILGVGLPAAPPAEIFRMHKALAAALESGVLRPLVSRDVPLAEAARAHAEMESQKGSTGKIVLVP